MVEFTHSIFHLYGLSLRERFLETLRQGQGRGLGDVEVGRIGGSL